ncbi:MAG: phosphoribosylanthranilate isomerase [Chlorobi bacterium]|nr:phosphoribosylanthranilate isomerase [Chlorobiota bacterium]
MNIPAVKIKVCGLKYPENILEIAALSPDYLGFIFYEKSPRYAGSLDPEIMKRIPPDIKKTGVFVNESVGKVLEIACKYMLDVIQLHGEETPAQCLECKLNGYEVIKAIPVKDRLDHLMIAGYLTSVNYLLFDTASGIKGGTGRRFNWDLIREYHGFIPFFLSGGVGPDSIPDIIKIMKTPWLYAVDINSRFETGPGVKDFVLISQFIKNLCNNE